MDLLDVLRRQAGRFQCPKCGESLADCQLEMVAQADEQSVVKVTCAHCQDTRMIAVAIAAAETEVKSPAVEVRDQPIDQLGGPITTDDVLDVRLALADFEGDLAGLLR
jgi:transcription elongation factor Elf1